MKIERTEKTISFYAKNLLWHINRLCKADLFVVCRDLIRTLALSFLIGGLWHLLGHCWFQKHQETTPGNYSLLQINLVYTLLCSARITFHEKTLFSIIKLVNIILYLHITCFNKCIVKKRDFKIFGTVLANPAIPANLFFYSTDRILRK